MLVQFEELMDPEELLYKDGPQGKLLKKLMREAGDPDEDAASWMGEEAPIGVSNPIEPGVAFPTITE